MYKYIYLEIKYYLPNFPIFIIIIRGSLITFLHSSRLILHGKNFAN